MNNTKYKACIIACSECATACVSCNIASLNEADVKMLSRCIRLTQACADICLEAVKSMAGNSEFSKQICKLCAEICTACAIECQKHAHMQHCKECEEACRACAETCSSMTNAYLYA